LQRYGQNERSLFTFLEANENHSITDFDINKHPIFNLCDVFNYLILIITHLLIQSTILIIDNGHLLIMQLIKLKVILMNMQQMQ
jgi:hypothetical protein